MHAKIPPTAIDIQSIESSEKSEERLHRLAYSVADAAVVSGLSRSTLYALMKAGLPSVKIGARRLIRHDDLVALLDHLTS